MTIDERIKALQKRKEVEDKKTAAKKQIADAQKNLESLKRKK